MTLFLRYTIAALQQNVAVWRHSIKLRKRAPSQRATAADPLDPVHLSAVERANAKLLMRDAEQLAEFLFRAAQSLRALVAPVARGLTRLFQGEAR